METTILGRTGRRVSRLGFGGAPAGLRNYLGPYQPDAAEHRQQVVAAVRRAFELGVTYYDTAEGYGNGASERIFGEGLDGVDPSAVFVATKVGTWHGGPLRPRLEASLRNLRRECLDLWQVHGGCYRQEEADAILKPGGALEEMERLRDEGLVRWLGFTVETPNGASERLIASGRFDVVQAQYNLLFQHAYDPDRRTGLMFDAEAHEMGVITMRTLTSGLFGRWMAAVDPSSARDYSPELLQYVLSNPLVDVALVGMRSAREAEENVRTAEDMEYRLDLAALFQRYV